MEGKNSPSDVSDEQWEILRRLMPPRAKRGRKPSDRRAVLNAILYVLLTGCQWRALPKDFPKWSSVDTIYRRWKLDGTWVRIHDTLRERCRQAAGKKRTPTAAIIDSQTAQTTTVAGDQRGYDAGKKRTGRKRHLAVDTLGLILSLVVHAASIQDQHRSTRIADQTARIVSTLESDLRRLGLWPQWPARLDTPNVWLDSANGSPTRRTSSFRGAPQTLDRRTHLQLDHLLETLRQRLRTPSRQQRNADLHPNDPPHVKATRRRKNLI